MLSDTFKFTLVQALDVESQCALWRLALSDPNWALTFEDSIYRSYAPFGARCFLTAEVHTILETAATTS